MHDVEIMYADNQSRFGSQLIRMSWCVQLMEVESTCATAWLRLCCFVVFVFYCVERNCVKKKKKFPILVNTN